MATWSPTSSSGFDVLLFSTVPSFEPLKTVKVRIVNQNNRMIRDGTEWNRMELEMYDIQKSTIFPTDAM